MFQVNRWLGGDQAKQKNPLLTLEQLNARASERAGRRNQVSHSASRPESQEVHNDTGKVLTLDVNGVPMAVADQEYKDLSKSGHEKEKIPKIKQEGGVVHKESMDGEELKEISEQVAPNPVQKKRKRQKKKTSSKIEVDSCPLEDDNAQPENGPGDNGMEVKELDEIDTPKKEKRKRKKKQKVAHYPEAPSPSEKVEEPALIVEVSNSFLPSPPNGSVSLISSTSDANLHYLSEKIDVIAADEGKKDKKKRKRKKLTEDTGTIDAQAKRERPVSPLADNARNIGDANEVSHGENDIATIEKDVERILGRDTAVESHGKGLPVLSWMRDPLDIDGYKAVPLIQVPGLDLRLQEALGKTGIETLFPVQMAMWHETIGPGRCERDVCVSSPTGSGKTLAYALPIVQKLSTRVIRLLRALIVLPTRDLAAQVKAVFDTVAPSVGLSVGLAVGQTSIAAEAAQLVKVRSKTVHGFGEVEGPDNDFTESQVDILVATPGRLMDHLRNTKGFTLQHLLYLVVDETDRLLRQSYQEWLPNVLESVNTMASESNIPISSVSDVRISCPGLVRTIRQLCSEKGIRSTASPRLMKMVLSATLTRDPAKISQLGLHWPIFVAPSAVDNRYQLPEQLRSFKLVCKVGEKPLYLVALLLELSGQQTIVFTASVVATHRLFTLLKCFTGLSLKVVEYSSLQHQQARSKSLARFRDGEAQVLVASDAMTRGMDVEGVANVVNYDMPVYAKTYVHRVGRTARAGQPGSSYTLLRREEVRHFQMMLKKVDNSTCKHHSLAASIREELYESYVEALEKLKEITAEEAISASTGTRKQNTNVGWKVEERQSGPDELFM